MGSFAKLQLAISPENAEAGLSSNAATRHHRERLKRYSIFQYLITKRDKTSAKEAGQSRVRIHTDYL
jgi:hypothetical protein